ncbi:MAG: hypothetical protein HQ518_30365 [Rhodopirellula sp.]|nr:hypothetical protein [Rhodopirellula sp.]
MEDDFNEQQFSMFQKWSIHPAKASLIGAGVGALALSAGILFFVWNDGRVHSTTQDQKWYGHLSLFPAIHGIWAGGIMGAFIGFSVWIVLTRRPLHPLYMAFAWGILAPVLCAPLHFWYWSVDAPTNGGSSGLGPAMRAVAIDQTYILIVMACSAICGTMLGGVAGIRKRSRR